MTAQLDAGPVYFKRVLSLDGLAEEIYVRAADVIADMIFEIISTEPEPVAQDGTATVFKRRSPDQSRVPEVTSLAELFDHIRMLDAAEYPRAFLEYNGFRFEFSRPAMRSNALEADVTITKISKKE
jgi:methionyl-tRNA formyltransferase